MTEHEFRQQLAAQGFGTVVAVERAPNAALDLHTHPFEAMALVQSGAITIVVDGLPRQYGPGEVFHLAAEVPHTEQYGPQGVRYVAGRK